MLKGRKKSIKQEQNRDSNPSSRRRAFNSQEMFEVESIVKKKVTVGKIYYMIKWIGYPHSQNTWEPIEHLGHIKEMVTQFQRKWEKTKVTPKKATIKHEEQNRPSKQKKNRSVKKQRIAQQAASSNDFKSFIKEMSRERYQEHKPIQKQQIAAEESKIQLKGVRKPFAPLPSCKTQLGAKPQKFGGNSWFLDSERFQQIGEINKSSSLNHSSSSSFVIDDDSEVQKAQTAPNWLAKPELYNLKSLRDHLKKQQENTPISRNMAISKQLLQRCGVTIIQVSKMFCEVRLLNTNTNQTITGCMVPLKTLLQKEPRLLDVKIGEVLEALQVQESA